MHTARDMMRSVRPADDLDDELVARSQTGDRSAFEQLVRRHADGLHAVVRRLILDDHEAQEVTQEAFLRAWRAIGAFEGEARFFTWLYRIGVNEANRRLKATPSGRQAPEPLHELTREPRDPRPSPARQTEQRDLRDALERAVRGLHPDYRTPLVLRDIEGLTTEEAAGIMQLAPAAFKSRLHRARKTVRADVAGYLED